MAALHVKGIINSLLYNKGKTFMHFWIMVIVLKCIDYTIYQKWLVLYYIKKLLCYLNAGVIFQYQNKRDNIDRFFFQNIQQRINFLKSHCLHCAITNDKDIQYSIASLKIYKHTLYSTSQYGCLSFYRNMIF